MFNKIILMGYLTKELQQKDINGHTNLVIVNIAYTHKYKNTYGEQIEKTLFIDATLWGRLGEIAMQYTHKGSKILIEGRLDMNEWTDQHGNKRQKYFIATESIKLLDNKPREEKAQKSATTQAISKDSNKSKNIPKSILEIDITDDEIPF